MSCFESGDVHVFENSDVKNVNIVSLVINSFLYFSESIAAVCKFFPKGTCIKGSACPLRHVRDDRTVVCKHWLRGLCKKGDQCEFLHEYDMTKMPECYFYSRFSKYLLRCLKLNFLKKSMMIFCQEYGIFHGIYH